MIDAPEGKPYAFLPLAPVEVDAAPPHDRIAPERYAGWLGLRLAARTPVTVLCGDLAVDAQGTAYAAMARLNGRPCLPGSSVKGVTRAVVEASSPSCAWRAGRPACVGPSGDRACPACRMFGFVAGTDGAYRSRVRMDDFLLQPDGRPTVLRIPRLFGPHPEVYGAAGRDRGRKFYFHGQPEAGRVPVEVAPENSAFEGRVYFDNLSRAEAALLFFALGLDGSFDWKLGYAKPAYLGSLRPHLVETHFLTEAYGQRVGRAEDPQALAREYAETGCGWAGAAAATAALRAVLGRDVVGPPWAVGRGGVRAY